MRALGIAALLASILFLGPLTGPVGATPDTPARFEVLQAAFYSFAQAGPTNQSIASRCVLLELFTGEAGSGNSSALNASDELLANTTRQSLALIRYAPNETVPTWNAAGIADASRFLYYYGGSLVPTAIFDGTAWDFAPGNGTDQHYRDLYNSSSQVPPGASINASGSLVITTGTLHFEVFSPFNLSGHRTYLRAALVEDNVSSGPGGRVLQHVLRGSLGAFALPLEGNSSIVGQFDFHNSTAWVESQLGVVLFVQSDGPPVYPKKGPPPSFDIFATFIVPVAVLVTGAAMVLVVARFITSERRARLR
jgi:hypothetical protein